jgi:hypothetical protein
MIIRPAYTGPTEFGLSPSNYEGRFRKRRRPSLFYEKKPGCPRQRRRGAKRETQNLQSDILSTLTLAMFALVDT